MGEVKRVLAWSHKSAEPIEVERAGTSDPVSGSACKPAMVRETELMEEASLEYGTRQLGSGRDDLVVGGELVLTGFMRTGGMRFAVCQPWCKLALRQGRIPYGVELAPKAGQRSNSEPKNLVLASLPFGMRMTEATRDRGDGGRSLRSSLRAGKPSTRSGNGTGPNPARRREAVDTVCRQEVDLCPAR